MIHNILDFIGYRSLALSNRLKGRQIHPEASWKQYYADDPNELLRITYPLDSDSLVVDVGGFKGEWSQRIYSRYCCYIDIYEPHPMLVQVIREHFKYNHEVRVIPIGLGNRNETLRLFGSDIYSSLYSNYGAESNEVAIRKASDVFRDNYSGIVIDLLKINIEGSEYQMLPDLIANYSMSTIRNIQIQFHNTVPEYWKKREKIQRELGKTHTLQWCYDFLYESWVVK